MTDLRALLAPIRARHIAACDYPGPVTIEESQQDVEGLLAAIEAGVARMEDRANMLSSTAERLAKQVMDRDPEAEADAAVRYGHYALEALSAVAQLKSALAAALGSDTTNQEGTQ